MSKCSEIKPSVDAVVAETPPGPNGVRGTTSGVGCRCGQRESSCAMMFRPSSSSSVVFVDVNSIDFAEISASAKANRAQRTASSPSARCASSNHLARVCRLVNHSGRFFVDVASH